MFIVTVTVAIVDKYGYYDVILEEHTLEDKVDSVPTTTVLHHSVWLVNILYL